MSEKLTRKGEVSKINYFDQEDKDRITKYVFDRIESGMSLFTALIAPDSEKKTIVSPTVFYKWLDDNVSYMENYTQACKVRYDILAEQTLAFAQTPLIATKVVESEKGIFTTTYDNVERSKLMVQSVQWYVTKLSGKYSGRDLENGEKHVEQPLFNDIG